MKNIKVFIGSSSSDLIDSKYEILASEISKKLAESGCDFVFGAASVGMMGKCYEEFFKLNKLVYSYTVSKYKEDLKNLNSCKQVICPTTFGRTSCIYNEADVFLFLPGGTGTIAELFSILEENRSVDNQKEVIIYNYEGYYDKVIDLIEYFISNNFNSSDIFNNLKIYDSISDVLDRISIISNYKNKKIRRKQ